MFLLLALLACGDTDKANGTGSGTGDEGGDVGGGATGDGGGAGSGDDGGSGDGGDGGDGGSGGSGSSFTADIYPALRADCLGCHWYWGDDEAAVHDHLLTFTGNTGMVFVTPEDVDNSYVWLKLTEESPPDGRIMPFQLSEVGSDDLAIIEDWIRGGAAGDAAFTEEVWRVLSMNRCTGCHQREWGLESAEVYTFLTTQTYGDLAYVDPGSPETSALYLKMTEPPAGALMPLMLDRWDDAELAAFQTWVDNGAALD